MAKYVAYMKQRSEGCDYTIGCGTVVKFMKSDNLTDAKKEAKSLLEYYGSRRDNEYELKEFIIMEVNEYFSFLDEFYNEFENEERLKKEKDTREKEMKEFERLKAKFQ